MARRGSSSSRRSKFSTREYGVPATKRNYAYPRGAGKDRGKRPSYPIDTIKHARAALAYAGRRNTAGSYATVARAVRARYGNRIHTRGH